MTAGSAAAALGVFAVLVGAGVVASQAEDGRPEAATWPAALPGVEQPLRAAVPGAGQAAASAQGYVVAEVKGAVIDVRPAPDPATAPTQLGNPTEVGAPRVFLATKAKGEWLEVLVPVRPNATKGWIKRSEVVLKSTPYRIDVDLSSRTLTLSKGGEAVMRETVGVGKSVTATPAGLYFVTELLQPPNPHGAYGPYAFGTSAFSDVLTDFQGGNGVIGIHGTNDPSSLGKDVSHGCIRLSNAAVTRLAGLLPLGTPVFIAA
jgi:lipoprotein-anchoring transpeptidase ErfK/SrfK